MLIDTHCHIHEADYPLDRAAVLERARAAGVGRLILVGTSVDSSYRALEMAAGTAGAYAAIGVHPHEAKDGYAGTIELAEGLAPPEPESTSAPRELQGEERLPEFISGRQAEGLAPPKKLVAIGEIGLDYFYDFSPRDRQIAALEAQIDLAQRLDRPIIFHVRAAFDDFWPIFDNFPKIRGELHSFTDSRRNLDAGLKRGLYVGVNGISTFTKDPAQAELLASIPLERLLLETDAPFLTPVPYRGKVNEPAFVREVAAHQARVRGLTLDEIAAATSANAEALFGLV